MQAVTGHTLSLNILVRVTSCIKVVTEGHSHVKLVTSLVMISPAVGDLPWSKSTPAVAATCLLLLLLLLLMLSIRLSLVYSSVTVVPLFWSHSTAEKQQLTAAEITQAKDLQGGMGPKGLHCIDTHTQRLHTLCEKSGKTDVHNDLPLAALPASTAAEAAAAEQQLLALNHRLAVGKLQSSLMCERARYRVGRAKPGETKTTRERVIKRERKREGVCACDLDSKCGFSVDYERVHGTMRRRR